MQHASAALSARSCCRCNTCAARPCLNIEQHSMHTLQTPTLSACSVALPQNEAGHKSLRISASMLRVQHQQGLPQCLKMNDKQGHHVVLRTPRRASKKQKKMAELRPLESERGPTPLKKGAAPRPSAIMRADADASVGRLDALHIMTVLTTSSGVVTAAAAAPAAPPINRSSTTVGCASNTTMVNISPY